jgi:hypothetical protein
VSAEVEKKTDSKIASSAKCPSCGWIMPLGYRPARPFRKVFDCQECSKRLRLTRASVLLEYLALLITLPLLWAVLVSDISFRFVLIICVALAMVYFVQVRFVERLELYSPDDL